MKFSKMRSHPKRIYRLRDRREEQVWVQMLNSDSAEVLELRPEGFVSTGVILKTLDTYKVCSPFFGDHIIGLAYNFKSLVGIRDQYDEPLFFLKSKGSNCHPGDDVTIPKLAETCWVEAELTIIVKDTCKGVAPENADRHILGFTVGSDVTVGNVCGRDHHLARSKAADSFAPLGPCLVTALPESEMKISTFINGTQTQEGFVHDQIYDYRRCLSLVSQFITLSAGDAILTGTPAGAMDSVVRPGDHVIHEVSGIGTLEFRVR